MRLTRLNGIAGPLYINPEHVVAVIAIEDKTHIYVVADEKPFRVTDPLPVVIRQLTEERT